jgi:ATP-dependent DNA helicase RecG
MRGEVPVNREQLLAKIAMGEDSMRQFKGDVTNAESLAAEMVAFANTHGGTILIGVHDDGSTPGLSQRDVGRVNQLISNTASQLVRSPLAVQTENIALDSGRLVIVLTVPKGIDKPYFDKNGVIWLKAGADKRRVNSKEELRRLFQLTSQFHADELPTQAGTDRLDKLRFRDFLRDVYGEDYPESQDALIRLLQNMNLATDDGRLNLAGVLLFAERPEWIAPQFVVKAIRYPGDEIHSTEYLDTEDFAGPLAKVFDGSLAFVMRNLHKVQAGRGVNAPGMPEIPEAVFEELLVNALVHRDYLASAPVRLFVFDNRIEIISPGHLPNGHGADSTTPEYETSFGRFGTRGSGLGTRKLPRMFHSNNLTVEKIRTGNSNIRNPILVSYVAKGLLPYHGLGSGIKRALANWSDIEFIDDQDGCLFTVKVHRKPVDSQALVNHDPKSSPKSSPKTEDMIMALMRSNPSISTEQIGANLGITKRAVLKQVDQLKKAGRLRRVGPAKGGHWEVL